MLLTASLVVLFLITVVELTPAGSKKSSSLLTPAGLMILFALIAFNRKNADYSSYARSFANNNPPNEIGYRFLVNGLNFFGLPFESVLFLMGVLLLVTVWFYLGRDRGGLALLLYLAYPLALDLPQIRNDLMYLLVMLAFWAFQQRGLIGRTLMILLGASMHVFGLLYIPLAWMVQQSRRIYFRTLVILTLALTVIVVVFRLLETRLPHIIAKQASPFDWFYYAVMVLHILLDLAAFWWVDRTLNLPRETPKAAWMETLYRIGFYTAIALPLVGFSAEMYRFRRNAQLVKYIYCAKALPHLAMKDKLITLLLVVSNLVLAVIMLYIAGDMKVYSDLNFNILAGYAS